MTAAISHGPGLDDEGRTSEVSTRKGTEVDGPVQLDWAGLPLQTRHASRHVRDVFGLQPMTAAFAPGRGLRLRARGRCSVPLIVVLCAVNLAVALGMLSDPALRWVGTAPRTVVSL